MKNSDISEESEESDISSHKIPQNDELRYISDRVRALEMKNIELEKKNFELEERVSGSEEVLIKELFQAFTQMEGWCVCGIGCCTNFCTCFCLIIVFGSVFAIFLRNFVMLFSDNSLITSETVMTVDRKNGNEHMFPMFFYCTWDAPRKGIVRDMQGLYILEYLEPINSLFDVSYFEIDDITLSANPMDNIRHKCYVGNYKNAKHEIKKPFEGFGNLFPYKILMVMEEDLRNEKNVTDFSWFIPIHHDFLDEIHKDEFDSPQELYEHVLYKSREKGFNPKGVTFRFYQLKKTFRETRFQLLDLLLIGLFFEFKTLIDVQYISKLDNGIGGEEPVCNQTSMKCETFTAVDVFFDYETFIEVVQRKTQSDFTAPFVATGGILVTLKLIPALILSCWGYIAKCIYSEGSLFIRKKKRKQIRNRHKQLAEEFEAMEQMANEEDDEKERSDDDNETEVHQIEVEMQDWKETDSSEDGSLEKKLNSASTTEESESEESSEVLESDD